MMGSTPQFGELSPAECQALLARNAVARVAFTFHDRVDIEPIGYAYADGWIVGRTSPGTKLTKVLHNPWVALEVDEVRGPYDWTSVVVHGTVDLLSVEGPPKEREAYARAVQTLQKSDARAFGPADPVPHRTIVFRIRADEVTGRRASTK